MNKKEDTKLRRTALHEAGHCVAFIRLLPDRVGSIVTIEPDKDEGTLGHHAAEDFSSPPAKSKEELAVQNAETELDAVCYCAGFAAVRVAGFNRKEAEYGCGGDFECAESFSRQPLEALKEKAIELMQRVENIRAVRRLTDELLIQKTIGPDMIEDLVALADGEITEEEYRAFIKMGKYGSTS